MADSLASKGPWGRPRTSGKKMNAQLGAGCRGMKQACTSTASQDGAQSPNCRLTADCCSEALFRAVFARCDVVPSNEVQK